MPLRAHLPLPLNAAAARKQLKAIAVVGLGEWTAAAAL